MLWTYSKVASTGQAAGLRVLNLADRFTKAGGLDALAVSSWDWHPNEPAHKKIAEELGRLVLEVRPPNNSND